MIEPKRSNFLRLSLRTFQGNSDRFGYSSADLASCSYAEHDQMKLRDDIPLYRCHPQQCQHVVWHHLLAAAFLRLLMIGTLPGWHQHWLAAVP